jgi:D-3-phosphoglycerate dehydrogenase
MNWIISTPDGLASPGMTLLREQAEVIDQLGKEALGSIDAIIVRSRTKVTDEIISSAAPRLKVIGRAGVGVDNINLQSATEHGLIVVNTPDGSTTAVAEHCLGLMLALARSIPFADAGIRRGEWRKTAITGGELSGKTVGIIGIGRSGSALAARCTALGMTVLGYDPYVGDEQMRQAGAEPVPFQLLLSRSDYITLNLPLTEDTYHLINQNTLQAVKPGARIVSTSRGGIIDEAALLSALDEGRLAGVALDVFEEEPPGMTSLTAHPRTVMTPHIGGQTAEAQAKISLDIAEEVLNALAGKPLRWQVNHSKPIPHRRNHGKAH